tara:strand:+ start:137 stop:241 length:105 start_codon:yes stop_codon:yes gene_type:complete
VVVEEQVLMLVKVHLILMEMVKMVVELADYYVYS